MVVEHDVGFRAHTLAERDRQRFHRIRSVSAPSSADFRVYLQQACREWPGGEDTLLLVVRFPEGAGSVGNLERRRLWAACHRAARIGVLVASAGPVADDLLGTDPYR